jgi:hypothetical protein
MILRYTIDEFPSLVYFEQEIPSVFDGDLENGREVLAWVVDLLTGADIEEVQTQTPNPKCRLYWSLIEFIDWRHSQSCWYFFDPS